MDHQRPISKRLFIEELEKPARADALGNLGQGELKDCEPPPGKVTTLALGEECFKF